MRQNMHKKLTMDRFSAVNDFSPGKSCEKFYVTKMQFVTYSHKMKTQIPHKICHVASFENHINFLDIVAIIDFYFVYNRQNQYFVQKLKDCSVC